MFSRPAQAATSSFLQHAALQQLCRKVITTNILSTVDEMQGSPSSVAVHLPYQAAFRPVKRRNTRSHPWDPLLHDRSQDALVVASPGSPAATHRPQIFVDERSSRESDEDVMNLIRSVSIAVFLRLRHELIQLQGLEFGDPGTLQKVFGKSETDITPQDQLIKLLSGITLSQLRPLPVAANPAAGQPSSGSF